MELTTKPVFLIGFMGSGKTTLGRRLANTLGYAFVDMDEYLEEKYKKSIPKIFETDGEEAFRIKEHETLAELTGLKNTVISTGGGAPCFFDNMEIINRHGISIYIRVPAKTLVQRLKSARVQRPLIKGMSEAELLVFIEETLKKREPFYMQAQHCIEGIDLKVQDLLYAINSQS